METGALFQDTRFLLIGVNEHEVERMRTLISSQQGKIVNFMTETPTYVITELNDPKAPELSEAIEVFGFPVINILWVKLCCEWNRLIPPSYFNIHRSRIFSNVVAVVTETILREDLCEIWAMLSFYGGRVVLAASAEVTHAIVSSTADIQALNIDTTHVHVVTPDWLTESLRAKSLKPELDFHPAHLVTARSDDVIPVVKRRMPSPVATAAAASQGNSSNAGTKSFPEFSMSLEQMLMNSKDTSGASSNNIGVKIQPLVKPDTKSALAKLLSDRQQQLNPSLSSDLPSDGTTPTTSLQSNLQPAVVSTSVAAPLTSTLRFAAPVLHAPSFAQSGLLRLATSVPITGGAPTTTLRTTALEIADTPAVQRPSVELLQQAPTTPAAPEATTAVLATEAAAVATGAQAQHPLLNQMLSTAAATSSSMPSSSSSIDNNAKPLPETKSADVTIADGDVATNTGTPVAATTTTTTTPTTAPRTRVRNRKRESASTAASRQRMQSGLTSGTAAPAAAAGYTALTSSTPTNKRGGGGGGGRPESPAPVYHTVSYADDLNALPYPKDLFFAGCTFYMANDDLKRTYTGSNAFFIAATEQLIENRGGTIFICEAADAAEETNIVSRLPHCTFVVSVQVQSKFMADNDIDSKRAVRFVTPDWLWYCDALGRLVPPETLLHLPVVSSHAFSGTRVAFANFTTLETRLLTQYTAALGACACEYLTRDCDLVVCKSLLGHKFTAAYEWQIPTVNCAWLADNMLLPNHHELNCYAARYQEYLNPKADDALRALKVADHRQLAAKGQLMHGWLEPVRVTAEQVRVARERQCARSSSSLSKMEEETTDVSTQQTPVVAQMRHFSIELHEDRVKRLRSDRLQNTVLMNAAETTEVGTNTSTAAAATAAASSAVCCVSVTGFTVGQTVDLRERLVRLGAQFVDEISGARVLIAQSPTRTLKFLAAVNCCPHIVGLRWLQASEKAEKLLTSDADLITYRLSDAAAEKRLGFDLGRSLRERDKSGLGKLFAKMTFHIAPAVEFGRGSLEYLIETGGGSFEQPFKSWHTVRDNQRADSNSRMIVIGHPNFPDEFRYLINHGIAVYSPEFVVDAVFNQALNYGRNRIDKPFRAVLHNIES